MQDEDTSNSQEGTEKANAKDNGPEGDAVGNRSRRVSVDPPSTGSAHSSSRTEPVTTSLEGSDTILAASGFDRPPNYKEQVLGTPQASLIVGPLYPGPEGRPLAHKDQVQSHSHETHASNSPRVSPSSEEQWREQRLQQQLPPMRAESSEVPVIEVASAEEDLPPVQLAEAQVLREDTWLSNRRKPLVAVALAASLITTAIVTVGILCGTGNCGSQAPANSSVNQQASTLRPSGRTTSPPVSPKTSSPTASPIKDDGTTLSPVTQPQGAIIDWINSLTFLGKRIGYPSTTDCSVSPQDSPEECALQWVIDDDPLQLAADTADGRFRLQQRYALAAFRFATSGQGAWENSAGWLTGDEECEWQDIVACEQGAVAEIVMKSDFLLGHITPDLALLKSLRKIDLTANQVAGTIPASIGTLIDLQVLIFGSNRLTGTLPNSLGNLSNLINFDMRYNSLRAKLPNSIGNWVRMERFNVRNNNLTGTIPDSISGWKSIVSADFSSNGFSGSVPNGICSVASLTTLCVDGLDCDCCTC